MKILFIGDITTRSGRDAVIANLAKVMADHDIDFTIANGENAAHGKGITSKIYYSLINSGIDCITLGNHAFSKSEIMEDMDKYDRLIRPVNIGIHEDIGQGYRTFGVNGYRICVINIMGSVFMNDVNQSPFEAMSHLLYQEKIRQKEKADFIFVDLHAEATSEKILFANYFKNELIAVVGTHTHVQTADERIIGNLAYISDVGMCGPYDSIIGRDIDEMVENLIYGNPTRFTPAEGESIFQAVVIEIDESLRKATNIERIQIRPY